MTTHTQNEFVKAVKQNSQPKYVVSSTLEKAEWAHSMLIRGDAVEQIRRLKQQPGGDIRLTGSPTLARSLMQAGLIDEYWLLVHPLVRGHGKRFFQDGMEPVALELIETQAFRSGVVLLRYQQGKP
jgi:dihydrofolate reductase